MIPKLMSLSDKNSDNLIAVRVYHVTIARVKSFVVSRVTNSFMYDIANKKYKRTYVYATLEEAEMKQYRMNRNFLSRNNLSITDYNETLTNLLKYVELDKE